MKEMLENKIANIETELNKQSLQISNLTGFVKGHVNGFNVAKHNVIDMLSGLPNVSGDDESLNNFFISFIDVLEKIKEMKPMFEDK